MSVVPPRTSTAPDYSTLERRLRIAEQAIRQQDEQIRALQAAVDSLLPASNYFAAPSYGAEGGYVRERSRTPRPVAPASTYVPARHPGPATSADGSASSESFALANGLDEKCLEVLLSQTPEVQRYVISMGPAEGRNPSAMVMGRITKATGDLGLATVGNAALPSGDVGQKVEDFIAANCLDEKCGELFRNAAPECQIAVMNLGGAEGRNPSAMVMGRMKKYERGEI
eukprot:CAMPEP_0115095696 /NCGR_PEP_ID=MMETSP0227-20121206/29223_1 /TAXON_ID=89957 /ORGANISM="Polarella glacialis, Strain CCMP 1383" /LENGTH=226 /DNA_ID=CAMNT_0002489171 /DNA_START=51 /DNA_END=731 /DNA_ORIENTATION=-